MAIDCTPSPGKWVLWVTQRNLQENVTPGNNPWVPTSWQLICRLNKGESPSRSPRPVEDMQPAEAVPCQSWGPTGLWPSILGQVETLQVLLDIFLYLSSLLICNLPSLPGSVPGSPQHTRRLVFKTQTDGQLSRKLFQVGGRRLFFSRSKVLEAWGLFLLQNHHLSGHHPFPCDSSPRWTDSECVGSGFPWEMTVS